MAFNTAIFEIPLYKIPLVPTLSITVPMLLLSIICLGVFYQSPDI